MLSATAPKSSTTKKTIPSRLPTASKPAPTMSASSTSSKSLSRTPSKTSLVSATSSRVGSKSSLESLTKKLSATSINATGLSAGGEQRELTVVETQCLQSRDVFAKALQKQLLASDSSLDDQEDPVPSTLAEAMAQDRDAAASLDITVGVRVRPLLSHELASNYFSAVAGTSSNLSLLTPKRTFDGKLQVIPKKIPVHVAFGEEVENEIVYRATTLRLMGVALGGGVGTLMAYGQTGSGKTHTLTGVEECVARDLWKLAKEYREMHGGAPSVDETSQTDPFDSDFTFKLSFFELFGSQGFDLLNERAPLSILEDKFGQIQVHPVTEHVLTSPAQFLHLIATGAGLRKTATTHKNRQSSRSHAVCRIKITNRRLLHMDDGVLNLIDLAGSEGSADTKFHDKERINEAKEINKSLAALKECVRQRGMAMLGQGSKHVHVPYRGTRLTILLKDAFELGSAKQSRTVILGAIAPSVLDMTQTVNTARFLADLHLQPSLTRLRRNNDPNSATSTAEDNDDDEDPKNPSTWSPSTLHTWIQKEYPQILPSVLCPYESGKQLMRLPEGIFMERCMSCEGVTEKRAKAFYLKLWRMVVDCRTKGRKEKLAVRLGKEEQAKREHEDDLRMAASGSG
ncbi:P-loop containing nucleoside triphosphate hydrolase protein [Phlyctochytrium arcticum]|nr:P-loop containing nucleoside triphosphate hydrolase protein [Phlyctochytrium arcticum]